MRDKRIILCDADDTIENLCQTWVTYLNRMYGTTVHSSEIVDWNVSLFFPSLTKEQVYDPIFNKNFWKEINPIDGCYKVLKEIRVCMISAQDLLAFIVYGEKSGVLLIGLPLYVT